MMEKSINQSNSQSIAPPVTIFLIMQNIRIKKQQARISVKRAGKKSGLASLARSGNVINA